MGKEPAVTETKVSFGGGGKVAIREYGALTSDYHVAITRTYAIPEGWLDEQVTEFEVAMVEALREEIEPRLQAEFDERFDQSYLSKGKQK